MDILSSLKQKLGMKTKVEQLGKVAITVEEDYWDINKSYDRLVVVEEKGTFTCYMSRVPVPAGSNIQLSDRRYWICIGKRSTTVTIGGFTILSSIDDLPNEDTGKSYLIDGIAYYYVGTGGDTKDELYQSLRITGEKGDPGLSAYELYLQNQEEPNEEITAWLETLKGEKGDNGDSALAIANAIRASKGQRPYTPEEFIQSLVGPTGPAGANGNDGVTPDIYVGSNGNWFVNDVDQNVKAQGPVGPQGPAGPSGGGGATNVYIDEENKRIVTVLNTVYDTPVLMFPAEENAPMTIVAPATYSTFLVNGHNLTADVNLSISGKFVLQKVVNGSPVGTGAASLVLTKNEVNSGDGATVRVTLAAEIIPPAGLNGSISVISSNGEFKTRYLSVRYQALLSPNSPGTVSGGGGQPEINPGVNPGVVGDDTYVESGN